MNTVLASSLADTAMVRPVQTSSVANNRSYTDASTQDNRMNINTNVSEARLIAIMNQQLDRRTNRASGIKATGGYG
jgi:hypothetical protein